MKVTDRTRGYRGSPPRSGALKRPCLPITLLLTAWLSGCGVARQTVVPLDQLPFPAKAVSRSELLDNLSANSQSIDTLTATIRLEASGGVLTTGTLTSYRETRGFLIVERPSHIRMKGEAPLALATVFDMVSDGEVFRVSVPLQNTFIVGATDTVGTSDNAILNLRPQHVLDALFVDVRGYLSNPQILSVMEESFEGRRSFYVFSFVDSKTSVPRLIEKVWIDRRNLTISRKQMFGVLGAVETDVTYSSYKAFNGVPFPQHIFIRRPVEDYSLRIEFLKTALNGVLPDNPFFLPAPIGSDLIRVGDAKSDH